MSTVETPAPAPPPSVPVAVRPLAKKRARPSEQAFKWLLIGLTAITLAMLAYLITSVVVKGAGSLSLDFLLARPSSNPAIAGFNSALRGSIVLMMITIMVAFPIGVAAALYLENFATQSAAATEKRLRERLGSGAVPGAMRPLV